MPFSIFSPLAFFVFSGCTCSCHLSGSLTHVTLSWSEACCPGEHLSRSQSEASSETAASENMKIMLLGSLSDCKMPFLKEVNTYSAEMHYIDQKKTVKSFIMLQKIYVSDKFCSFKCSIHQRIVKKCIMVFTKILSSTTVLHIDNNEKCSLFEHQTRILQPLWKSTLQQTFKMSTFNF